MRTFLSELRRRNVYKVGAAYAVVGWILIQATSILFPTFDAPGWVFKVFTLLLVLGFPLALVLAWAFELTPEGLKRSHEVPVEQSVARNNGRKLNFAIIGLLILALGVSVSMNLSHAPEARAASIAVLPFTSRSSEAQHAMFADGMHDELLTKLANIDSLKVISRTSVMAYRDTTKKLRQIGDELGVATVLEGAVQRSGETVRINVQLIDAATDEHLWANTYDREMSAGNLFAIQTEIATTIADKLQATLTPDERQRLSEAPTENLEAYNLYLAGRQNLYQRELENLQRARDLFEQVIELDPGFALAYAGLSDALNLLYFNYGVVSADGALARSANLLERAFALESEDADIHASFALLKTNVWASTQDDSDAEEAEEAFRRAIALNPNHAQALAWHASLADDRGDDARAIELYQQSLELDPLARSAQVNLALNYSDIGDHQRALERLLETARLNPDWPGAPEAIGQILASLGRFDEALAWYYKARSLSADAASIRGGVSLYMAFGQTDRAVELLKTRSRDHAFWILSQALVRRLEGDSNGALAMLEGALAQIEYPPPPFLLVASETAIQAGNFEAAREHLERLCPHFLEVTPRVDGLNCSYGVGYAYVLQRLGDPERATRILEAALDYLKGRTRFGPAGHGISDVEALALTGRPKEALAQLREAVDEGWRGSPWMIFSALRDDPYLGGLGDEPEFRAILAEVEADISRMRDRAMQAEASGNWQPLLALAESSARLAAETPAR